MKQALPYPVATPGGRRRSMRRLTWLPPLAFIAPSLLVIAVVTLYPFVDGLYLSLTNSSLLGIGSYVGLNNFHIILASSDFWSALQFTVIFAVCSVVGSYVVGLSLALVLNSRVPARGFFRAVLMIPWLIPPIVAIVAWRWMLDQSGVINTVLQDLGLNPIYFLSDTTWARVAVITVKIWVSFPFMMVTCLAALQGLSPEMYEAAAIDGAGPIARFWHITMPGIRMVTVICWLLMTIWSVNDFATIWLLTQGGPVDSTQTLITIAFRYAFQVTNVGLGAAVSSVMMLGMLAVGLVLMRVVRAQEEV